MTASTSTRWLWLLPEAHRALETRELAVILRCYRKFAGLSQVAMGELLGYDPSYVSLLERRQRTINDRQGLSHISRVRGVPPHALGITSDEDADFLAALQFGESTVRLAEIARQAGRAAEAVEELWPLVSHFNLTQRAFANSGDRDIVIVGRSIADAVAPSDMAHQLVTIVRKINR